MVDDSVEPKHAGKFTISIHSFIQIYIALLVDRGMKCSQNRFCGFKILGGGEVCIDCGPIFLQF